MIDRLMKDTNIPAQFRQVSFADYDPSHHRGAKNVLRRVEDWDPTDSKPNLVLQGAPNRGKTMLASALCNDYHEGYRPSKPLPGSAMQALLQQKCPLYFIQLAELITLHLRNFQLRRDVEAGIREPTEYLELDQLLEDLKFRVQVLVIDDVGKEHRTASGFAQDEFDLLVRTRYNAGLTTIYTTNLPVRRWSAEYSDSMQSLIGRSSLVLDFV